VLVAEAHLLGPIRASIEAAGLVTTEDPGAFNVRPASALVREFPYGPESASEVGALFDEFEPRAIVFIERFAPNEADVYHTLRGTRVEPDAIIPNHRFAAVARERGVFALGIGDGGNEIGFGRIHAQAKKIVPAGERCGCPCALGVISAVPTDVVIPAATANLGAYGVTAMLAHLLGKRRLLHDYETELRMLGACVDAGAADGATGLRTLSVDGMSKNAQMALITLLGEIVDNAGTALGEIA
jgi:hypothetical protein